MKKVWYMRNRYVLPIIYSCLLLFAPASGEYVTVAHLDVPVEELDARTLQKIFQGKMRHWSCGGRIIPVTLKSGGALKGYVEQYFSLSPSQYSTYWKRRAFTGRGTPPKSFESYLELLEYVGQTEGSIGFIEEEQLICGEGGDVKVIHVQY
jgi:ABC-type phosphate transport system substrate-binding protein